MMSTKVSTQMIVIFRIIFVISLLYPVVVLASVDTTSVYYSTGIPYSYSYSLQQECFIEALNRTQSCSNKNLLYVTTMGGGSGLGSEFNAYFMPSLLTAIAEERRMVYVRSKRKWEYDCASESGWACYLAFPCEENGIEMANVDLSQRYLRNDDSSLKFPNMTSVQLLAPRNNKIYEIINSVSVKGSRSCKGKVDSSTFSVTMLTSMAGRFLYQLNSQTKAAIRQLNSHYKSILQSRMSYLAVQIRMTDKKYEMSAEAWDWVNNLSNTVNFIRPYFKAAHTNKLYAASDNCTAVQEMVTLLPDCQVFSPCFNNSDMAGKRHGGEASTYALLADIEMLRRGKHFFGLFDSNLVRMIHRIRFPVLNNSHCLNAETYHDGRVHINKNMEDIGIQFDT